MHRPPGDPRTADPRRKDVSEHDRSVNLAVVAELINRARRDVSVTELGLSANKLSRIVRKHLADDDRLRIAYRDPTGEAAVRNAMRGAR